MYSNAKFMRRILGQTAGRCHDYGNDLPKTGLHPEIPGECIQLHDRRISYGTKYTVARSIGRSLHHIY